MYHFRASSGIEITPLVSTKGVTTVSSVNCPRAPPVRMSLFAQEAWRFWRFSLVPPQGLISRRQGLIP